MLQKLQETLNKLTTLFSYIKLQIDNKLDIGSAAATADKLTAPFTLALSGDATATAQVDGSGPVSLAMILKDIGITAGSLGDSITIPIITVDAKGRVTALTGVPVRAGTTSQTGVVQLSTSVSSPSAATAATSGAVKAAYDLALTKLDAGATAAAANKLITARTISLTGDGAWTVSFDGTGNVTGVMTLAATGIAAGTYNGITVDAKGRVTAAGALVLADIPALTIAKTTGLQAALDAKLGATATAASADKWSTARSLSVTGDATGTTNIDGSANASFALTLANSGVVAGSYAKVTVNAKGIVTGGAALTAADIPALDAGKTTTGVFAAARIPTLNQNTTGSAGSVNGTASGGAFADMFSRQGVVHAAIAHSGSSYAPLASLRYTGTGGVQGEYSFGHLSNATSDAGAFVLHHITSGGVTKQWTFDAVTGNFTSAGEVYNYSDKRLKEGFAVIDNALDRLEYITGYTFVRKDTGEIQAGFIANDWLAALPEVVDQTGEYLRLAYGNTNALTVNAVKELKVIVFKQAEEIEVLKNLVASLIK